MLTVRPVIPADKAQIRALLLDAFSGLLEANLVEELRDAGHVDLESVAEKENEIVGHILYSPVQIYGAKKALSTGTGLAPVAVKRAWQKKGVGSRLIRDSIEALKARGAAFAVVLGEPSYYSRFGFRPAASLGVRCEFEAPDDAFQVLPLTGAPIPRGTAKYAKEFDKFK